MDLNNNIKRQNFVPKRPHDAYDMNDKNKLSVGEYCHKGKESGKTKSLHERNAFRKENSLGRQRL